MQSPFFSPPSLPQPLSLCVYELLTLSSRHLPGLCHVGNRAQPVHTKECYTLSSKHLPCLWEALGFFSVPQTVLLRPDSHLVQFMHSKRWSGSAEYSQVRQLLQLSSSRTVHHPRE